jgi:hypothetical protein
MTAPGRVYLDPPIAADIYCRNCDRPIVAAAKVVPGDGRAGWFVFQHTDGAVSCPSPATAEPFNEVDAYGLVEALYAEQAADGGVRARSAQRDRVDGAYDRLMGADKARRESLAAGDRTSAGHAAGALRDIIGDLPMHDLRSLATKLLLQVINAEGAK